MSKQNLTQNTIFIVLMLIIVFPVGLYFMWRYKKFNTVARLVISAILILFWVWLLFIPMDKSEERNIPENPLAAESILQTEPKTSERVDAITRQAKKDVETASDEDLQTAYDFIKNQYPNYFDSNETMEKTIYYGAYLEYGHKETDSKLSELGMDAVQAVKYVYRGAEKVEDDGTQSNLEQIKKGLS